MEGLEDLQRIGLTEGEAKVYAALLSLGSSSVGPITKRTGVSYSNIYEILQRLQEKGIVTVIVKNNVRHFQAVNPGNLERYLAKKEQELATQRKLLQDALPRIAALQHAHATQEAMMFTGLKGLRAAYTEFFADATKEDENLWVYVHDEHYTSVVDNFYMHEWFGFVRSIKSRGIVDPAYRNTQFFRKFSKRFEIRVADFPLFSYGEVFQDKFLLVSWEKPIISVIVRAKHVSENFRKYFESVWEAAERHS